MKNSKRYIGMLVFLTCIVGNVLAASWIDLTTEYIVNPNFDGNDRSTGWEGTAFGAANPRENAEHYEKTFDSYQYLHGLTPGRYRVSVYAFYRMGSADNDYRLYTNGDYEDYQYAQLYATSSLEENYEPIAPASSAALETSLGGSTSRVGGSGWWSEGGYYIPNNMEAAYYWFSAGYYKNTVEVVVGDDGELRIGVRKFTTISSDWMCLDTWKLEYYGDKISVSDITLSASAATLVPGEKLQLEATVAPDDATIKSVRWLTGNKNVATVTQDGLVTATGTGNTTITVKATDGSNVSTTCAITVVSSAAGLNDILITEIQSANTDQFVDPSWNYGSWVELYNPATLGVTLTGCWVSDDPKDLKKVHISQQLAIPAQGYLNLWFNHHDKYCLTQLDMKLDVEGGTLYLSDSNGKLIVSQDYPPAVARCSYARKSLSGTEWGWSSTPTPEASNDGMTYAGTRLAAPEVDQPTQIFSNKLTVCVNIPVGATLRYTTDGSAPTATNGETSLDGLFYPEQTATYRFCLIADGYLPSPVVTRTYIYQDKTFALPVMSVVSEDKNLYSNEMGIFTRGTNGRAGNGQSTACNWNMDWDRPANFEYLNEEGEMVINQETAMERCGGWSRAWTPYSFKIKANKQYELQNYLPYQFFAEKPYLKHKTLQIRNGGNDTSCRIKDPALQEIVFRSGLDVDCQAYQPVMHYINGRYAGVINVREPNNKHFVYANYGLDDDEIDQFEMSPDSGYIQKCGTYESMQRWYDLSAECGTSDEAYEEIKQMVDIDEYCNYMAVEFYLGGTDWPQNNVKGFKPIMEGGKFRFVLFDLDGTFATTSPFGNFANKRNYTFDPLYGEPVSRITKEIELVTIFLNMIKNDDFRKQFIDTFCLVAGSVFDPDRCKEIINELASRVSDSQNIWNEVYSTKSTPWDTANSLISSLSSGRQSSLISSLKSYSAFGLSSVTTQNVQLSTNLPEARLLVNDLPVPTNRFNGRLFAPVTFKAQAPAGYRFLGWKLVEGTNTNATTILPNESTWQYYDQGSLDGEDWTSPTYDASAWESGQAPLGYFVGGDREHNTILDYGGNTSNKRPTYYFRHSLTLDKAPGSSDVFTLNYIIDDGLIIYVNGTEAGRYNMPSGTVTYSTFATTYAHDNPDSGSLTLDASLFHKGTNVIAVEIHNNEGKSTDIYWEGSITHASEDITGNYVCYEEEFEMPEGNMVLQACYEEMTPEEMEEADLATTPVVINEVSAGNSIYVNEYFKKDDWVELYNTTDRDIDLEGMYLTDRSEKPRKYQITAQGTKASTIIPAHGYKVIWCSKRDTDTELHANFKLDNVDSTVVRIMAKDGSWADSITYCAHNGDQTVGRYPDGGQHIYVMTQPTICKSNTLNTYARVWENTPSDTIPTDLDAIHSTRNGGMSLAYTGSELWIKSEEDPAVTLTIYTAAGATVMYQRLNLEGGHYRTSVAALPTGVYVAHIKDSEDNECITKFLKK